jgi:hypothetical protein
MIFYYQGNEKENRFQADIILQYFTHSNLKYKEHSSHIAARQQTYFNCCKLLGHLVIEFFKYQIGENSENAVEYFNRDLFL